MSLNIYHLIDSFEYPFELWNILKKYFGVQEVEDEAWSEPTISSCDLSQDVLASTFSDEFIYDEEVSHTVHVVVILFDLNASSFNEEANIEALEEISTQNGSLNPNSNSISSCVRQ